MDSISVNENVQAISVKDEDRQPVRVTNETIAVKDADESLLLPQNDNLVSVSELAPESLQINENPHALDLKIGDVLQPIITNITNNGPGAPVEEEMYTEQVDFVTDDLIYRGWATPGSTTAQAVWRIKRITFVGPENDVVQEWADGNTEFDNIWDNRASLFYS